MLEIDLLYDRRDWAVTMFRAGMITLLAAGALTAYLLGTHGAVSAAFGGPAFVIVAALPLVLAAVLYLPAKRGLAAQGVVGPSILHHLRQTDEKAKQAERDILDQLEKDLDL